MSSKNTMTRDAMLFLPAKVVEGVLIIACSSLYTHIFTKGAVGDYGIVNTTVQFTYLILAGWMANAAARYMNEENHLDQGRGLFSTMSTVYLLISIFVTVGCGIISAATGQMLYLGGAVWFWGYTLFQILNAALIQLGRIRASIVLSLTSAVLKLAIAYLLVRGFAGPDSAAPAIAANTIADGAAALGAVFVLGLPALARLRFFSKELLQKFLQFGLPLMGVSISVTLLNQIDKYLVTGIYGRDYFGIYNSNNSIAAGLFSMLSIGIMRGVYPAVLRAWRDGGKPSALPLLNQGVRLYLLFAAPAVTGLTAIALPLSGFLFADGYEIGAPVIAYTALAMLFMGLTEYANKAYELEQSTIHVLQNSAIAAVIKIISSFFLLYAIGFTGGALGSVIAFFSYFLITSLRVHRRFLFHLRLKTVLRIVISALLCGVSALLCTLLLPLGNLPLILVSMLVGAAVYAAAIVLSGEGKPELQHLLSRLRK